VGTFIGDTKGVVYTRSDMRCPSGQGGQWRYLDRDLEWREDGNIVVTCNS
jgi:hypothetical protein